VRSVEGGIALILDVERICQGARQRVHSGTLFARIPRDPAPIGAAICVHAAPCEALLP
jgi:hypothetical protein